MELVEKETLVLFNEADIAEGFFHFGTSIAADFTALIRAVGGPDKIEVKESTETGTNRTTYWSCRVPVEFLRGKLFSIGKPAKRLKSK